MAKKKKSKKAASAKKVEAKAPSFPPAYWWVIGAVVVVVLLVLIFAGNKPAEKAPDTAMGEQEVCGDSVCGAREYASGSCPADCAPQQAEPVVDTTVPEETGTCGDGICSDAEKGDGSCPADCEVANLDARPTCEGVGTSREGWYQNGRILFYAHCGGCTTECRNQGTQSEGWYNTCDDKQIKRICG